MSPLPFSRRQFLQSTSLLTLGAMMGCRPQEDIPTELDPFIEYMLAKDGGVGISCATMRGPELLWAKGYGFANKEDGIPMTADSLQNIGSISKTFTATAIMQLWEEGALQLEDDVNQHLPFSVRNPNFPDEPITIQQLLIHRSSIKDGPAYDASYACGDPAVNLFDWIEGYFTADGPYYDTENFHTWQPGTLEPPEGPRAYSNVAYGLLGVIVEQISQASFEDFTRERIFTPLGMNSTGWHLREIDIAQHARLYSEVPEDVDIGSMEELAEHLPHQSVTLDMLTPGLKLPHCDYSFYNYPDGLIRTSVNDFSRFLRAYMSGGSLEGQQILQPETVQLMLTPVVDSQGLCWYETTIGGTHDLWGHSGGDPGTVTFMGFRKTDNFGIAMFMNYDYPGEGTGRIRSRLLEG